MQDILLVQPQYEKYEESLVYSTSIPLNISYLAAALDKEGYDLGVLDLNVSYREENQAVDKILKEKPKILGISVSTPTLPKVYSLVKKIKEKNFNGKIVYGGPHITERPSSVVPLMGDFGFVGEGDVGLNLLCKSILKNEGKLREIPNLIKVDNGVIEKNKSGAIKDLDTLPIPKRNLFQIEKYKFIHLICSRGCPYNCSYCSMAGKEYKIRSVENVLKEFLLVVREYPGKSFGFGDDVFTLKREFVEEFCEKLVEKKVGVKWSCTTRVDLVDRELIEKMKSAGCWHISFGVESGVEGIRYSLGKRISNKEYEGVFSLCRSLGVKTRAYGMFGHPNENVGEMYETIKFIENLRPDDVFYSITSIYPNTKIADRALKEGWLSENIWEDNMVNGFGAPFYIPEGVSFEDMREVLFKGMSDFYATPLGVIKKLLKSRSMDELKQSVEYLNGFIATTLSR